ncbi:hypothetical protein ATO8_11864 [Roseivivax marinus]|uniref:Uncharacterized protein n=1 Tax=Roseivivax marinus TaxID=1379903 RepID=W4HJW7_9RHOB|nr:hypothetical protein [Roseivivax marinus]ETW12713.1 hypothetical protein ATO8_11864 [Roseivivax marinus]
MTHAVDAVDWSAVQTLQERMARQPSGGFWYDVYDHAIELVLSGSRREEPYLLRNVVRDAKTTVRRRKELEIRRFGGSLDQPEISCEVDRDPVVVAMRPTSAEVQLARAEQFLQFKKNVNGANPKAEDVLKLWLNGESVAHTAFDLSISPDYVKKIRKLIYAAAKNHHAESEAA